MNPGKKKNPLSSDKSWQFPKEKALGMYLMRKKIKKTDGGPFLPVSQDLDTAESD